MIEKDCIQYLSVNLLDVKNDVVNDDYQIANLLDVVDALDLEHSQYDVFELDDKKIISVEKYALKSEAIKGHDIFRLKDDIPVFVSERIKNIIEINALSDFAFMEVYVS